MQLNVTLEPFPSSRTATEMVPCANFLANCYFIFFNVLEPLKLNCQSSHESEPQERARGKARECVLQSGGPKEISEEKVVNLFLNTPQGKSGMWRHKAKGWRRAGSFGKHTSNNRQHNHNLELGWNS